jgi:hypothetical protein
MTLKYSASRNYSSGRHEPSSLGAAFIISVSPRAVYAQRGTNTLQHVFRDHFASFAADYDVRYAKELGNFRIERISRVATRFLACGDYRQGVARIRCSNPA